MTEITAAKQYLLTVEAMGDLFDFWNEKVFGGELEKPVITVCQDRRGRAFGWFVPARIWKKDASAQGSPEINMCAQYLDRDFTLVAGTLLHEMCHLYAFLHEIADTSSNGRYHNRAYRSVAESHGLTVEKSKTHGYSITELNQASLALLEEYQGERTFLYDTRPRAAADDFAASAEKQAKAKRPPSARYAYVCPKCGQRIKGYSATQRLQCAACGVPFDREQA